MPKIALPSRVVTGFGHLYEIGWQPSRPVWPGAADEGPDSIVFGGLDRSAAAVAADPESIEHLRKYIDKYMLFVKLADNLGSTSGDPRSLGFVFEVIPALFGEIGIIPTDGNVGFPGDIDIRPTFEVVHFGLDEQAAMEHSLKVAETDFTVPDWADADPASPELVLELRRSNAVRRRDDAVLVSKARRFRGLRSGAAARASYRAGQTPGNRRRYLFEVRVPCQSS